MSETLNVDNFPVSNIAAQNVLSADANAAQAVVSLDSVDEYAVNDYVLLGVKGQASGQLLQILSITGSAITFTSNLEVKHFRGETIFKLNGNKVRFYKATAPADNTIPADTAFAQIGSDTTIHADQLYTAYTDATGGSGYWYKYTFLNSTTAAETSLSSAIAVRGGGYGHYSTVEDVKREAGLQNNPYIEDTLIYEKLIAAESEVNGSLLIAGYTLPFVTAKTPDSVVNATRLIAAGYLLQTDYGPEHSGTNKDGAQKIGMGRKILQDLIDSKTQLIDPVTQLVVATANATRGYPDDSAASNTPPEDSFFKQTDIY